jgi:hypothetical protein
MIKSTHFLRLLCIVSWCTVAGGLSCKHATSPTPPPTPKPLDLLQPVGGEHYKVGDTIHIKWQVNSTNVSSVRVYFYKDSARSGLPDTMIRTDITALAGPGSIAPPDTTFDWAIDNGSRVSNSCTIQIHEYFESVSPDTSGVFSITLN